MQALSPNGGMALLGFGHPTIQVCQMRVLFSPSKFLVEQRPLLFGTNISLIALDVIFGGHNSVPFMRVVPGKKDLQRPQSRSSSTPVAGSVQRGECAILFGRAPPTALWRRQ